jgi:putative peptidoglycan lipid II flippase
VLLLLFRNQILRLFVSTKNLNLLKLATEIFELYVLTIPFNALFSVIAAFLQARFKFIAVAVSYVVINLSTVLLLLIAKNNFGVLGVAFSILVGTFMQFVFLIPFTYKFIKIRTGWSKLIKENKSLISGALLITLFIELISLSYSFIDRYFYTELIKGGISAINYAQTITSIPTNFYATTLVTLIFSHFSLNSGQKNDVANFYGI